MDLQLSIFFHEQVAPENFMFLARGNFSRELTVYDFSSNNSLRQTVWELDIFLAQLKS